MNEDQLSAWQPLLRDTLQSEAFAALMARVEQAYASETVYPPRKELFAAFGRTPPERVKCVILGQDPYHEPGQAHGLAFSVPRGVALPPSLRNLLRERETDLGAPCADCGDLSGWAREGVLLLNTVLTVRAGAAGSHAKLGWQAFTDAVVCAISRLPQPVAFVLWGAQAAKKKPLCEASAQARLVLCAPHPSPLSSYRGFFGSRPYSQVNAFLRAQGAEEIDWCAAPDEEEN